MAVKKITRRWFSRTFSVVMVIVAVMVMLVSYAIYTYYYNGTRQYLLTRAGAVTSTLDTYASDSSSDFSAQLQKLVENFEYKERMELMAIDGNGKVYLTSSGFEPQTDLSMPDYVQAMLSPDGIGEHIGTMNGEKIMAITVVSDIIGQSHSAMRYVVSLTRVNQQVHTLMFFVFLAGIAILLIVLFSSSYFISSIVNPISEVSVSTRQIAQGDFDVRLEIRSDDEIGLLCQSINNMAEELSNSEKVKNDFISSVSHELRTPLTAIRGWGETLMSEQSPDPATLQKGMQVIMQETERLSSMVEDLLDFSRLQSGRLNLDMQKIDLIAELSDAVLIFTERAKQENKQLIYQEPTQFAAVMADKNRLRQVFVNILDNALKYSDNGDQILIQVQFNEKTVQVIISDTGCGISDEDLPRVKTRFYKGNTTRRGSGIGLAVADEIVSMHGGSLELSSRKNFGTTVRITLPLL